MRKVEKKEVKRVGRPRKVKEENDEREEMLEAYDRLKKEVDEIVLNNENFALAVMCMPVAKRREYEEYKNGKGIGGVDAFLGNCNPATLNIMAKQLEGRSKQLVMEHPEVMFMRMAEKMEDEDDEFEW